MLIVLLQVSNQVGAPASGALWKGVIGFLGGKLFPIKWVPQRVGPSAMFSAVSIPSDSFQSSGCPSEWGQGGFCFFQL